MVFKGKGQLSEFQKLDKDLIKIVDEIDKECELLITSVFRSEEQQRALCKQMNKPFYRTPHSFYRAIDAVPHDQRVPKERMKELEEKFNKKYPYGDGVHNTCLFHYGTGWHLHVQVKAKEEK